MKTKPASKDLMPPIMAYTNYLSEASKKFQFSINECRNRYGSYTVGEWEVLLTENKTRECQQVLDLMDRDIQYPKALRLVLATSNREQEELEIELDTFV